MQKAITPLGEKRKDAQLSREFVLAVPKELSSSEQFQAAVEWAQSELVSRGMIAEVFKLWRWVTSFNIARPRPSLEDYERKPNSGARLVLLRALVSEGS
jgi:hypothetical protein